MSSKSIRRSAKPVAQCMLAILIMFSGAGCASVTVVRPLDPASAAVKIPASSVRVSYTNSCPTNVAWHGTIQKRIEPEIKKQLELCGFTISQNAKSADFSMTVNVSDFKIGQLTLTDVMGNVVQRGETLGSVTCDITYAGSNGVVFGVIKKVIDDGNFPGACKDIAVFTRDTLKTPKKQ
jgi:hypothetical protein